LESESKGWEPISINRRLHPRLRLRHRSESSHPVPNGHGPSGRTPRRHYDEAMASDDAAEWTAACAVEMESMRSNGVWELVDLPEGRKAIKSRWVFDVKRNEVGEVVRHKARLVAKGFSQVAGIDFAAIYDYEMVQVDAITAYLNGVLTEEVFMHQPKGFVVPGLEEKVCRLVRSISDSSQSPLMTVSSFAKLTDTSRLSLFT